MRIYICGPMSGYPDHNAPAFTEAANFLTSLGHDPVNPDDMGQIGDDADNRADKNGLTRPDVLAVYMRRDLPALLTCDAIMALPGWEKSRGANVEMFVATRCGMPTYHFCKEEKRWMEAFTPTSTGEPVA